VANAAAARTRPRLPAPLDQADPRILVGAAQTLTGAAREQYALQYKTWQDEMWEFTRSIGEFGSVMDWFSSGISRMHLVAATQKPGIREPEMTDTGPAAEIIDNLVVNARGGETQYLYKWGRHLGVAGVGYFIGEDQVDDIDGDNRVFEVKSAKQIRRSQKPFRDPITGQIVRGADGKPLLTGFDVQVAPNEWRQLAPSSLVSRIYRPDDELDYNVTSWARPAITTLREIDLYNRHIIATLLSRLVFNGFLFIPSEVTFPVNPQYKDASDPFIAELIAIASRGIRDPGSPASAIPVPLRVPAEFIEKFKHLIIATGIDPKVIEARAAALGNLSKQLPAPPEAMQGKSDLNHWNAYVDSEDNIKYIFGSTIEIFVGGLTEKYLWPMMRAAGVDIRSNGGRSVVWYDASDLVAKPDNSQNAIDARSRMTIDDEAYRKVIGLDSADEPADDELRKMLLVNAATAGTQLSDAYFLLFPEDKPEPLKAGDILPNGQVAGAPPGGAGPSSGKSPATGPSAGATNGATAKRDAPSKAASGA
jgi:hypothetical protein